MPPSEAKTETAQTEHVPAVLAGDSWDNNMAPPSDEDTPDDGGTPPADAADKTPDPDPQKASEPDPDPAPDDDAEPDKAADDAGDKTEPDADSSKELPMGAAKALERARRQRREAQTQAESLKAENARLKAQAEAREKAEKIDMNDFDTMAEYEAAVAEAMKVPEPAPETQGDAELSLAVTDIREACEDVSPDLVDKMMDEGFEISRDMVVAVADDPEPAAIIQHFVDNPAERDAILAMRPRAQERAIIRLGDQLARNRSGSPTPPPSDNADPPPPAPRKTSSAPEPIDPVNSRSPQTVTIETAKTQREFEAARERDLGAGKFYEW